MSAPDDAATAGWSRAVRSALGLGGADTPASRRVAGVVHGALSALGVQGIGLLAGLVSVPLAIGYLGGERYGAWVTIGSLIAWLSIADLGLGNELTNALSRAHAREDPGEAQALVASAFWALSLVSLVLFVLGAVAWWAADWPVLLNVRTPEGIREVGPAAGLAFALFCAGFPLSLTERVFISLQRGAILNAWMAATSVASLAAVVVATRLRGGVVMLVLATSGVTFALRLVGTLWLYGRFRPELRPAFGSFRRELALRLLGKGKDFFLIQIAALVLYSTDNVIIARLLGSTQVTPYAVSWRLFTIPNLVLTAAFPYLWAAYADALARGDGAWALRTLRLSTAAATASAIAVALPLVLAGSFVIRVWAGPAAVPPWPVLAWMGAWSILHAPTTCAVCFLNASGVVRWQVWAGLATAAVNVGLSVLWARPYGIAGVIAATVVSNVAIVVIPLAVVLSRVTGRLSAPGRAAAVR